MMGVETKILAQALELSFHNILPGHHLSKTPIYAQPVPIKKPDFKICQNPFIPLHI